MLRAAIQAAPTCRPSRSTGSTGDVARTRATGLCALETFRNIAHEGRALPSGLEFRQQAYRHVNPSSSISLCVSNRNRLWQLRQTLAANLAAAGDRHRVVLVDYGSTDDTQAWVWETFSEAIDEGRLTFFEVTNPVFWHMARAKNLSHRFAPSAYCFNLDADNFVDGTDLGLIEESARAGRVCHQFSGVLTDGSCGRIGLPKELFLLMGGYDESMLPMSWQDIDLVRRIRASGRDVVRLPAPRIPAIANTQQQKLLECGRVGDSARSDYDQMKTLNQSLAKTRMQLEGPYRGGGFASFEGRLNGQAVIIDGFDNIHPRTSA